MFPPGLARLATWPVLTGSACDTKIDVHLEPNQVGREFWEPSEVALGLSELDQDVLALDPAALPQA
jgi:hypothetical protein